MSKNSIMTTKELAQYIRINEKTVIKMAQKGQLPGVKVGNQWRFHLESIDKYLQNDIVKSSDEDLDLVIKTADTIVPLSRLILEDAIVLDSKAKNASEVLSELASIAFNNGFTVSEKELLKELKLREKMLSTAVGERAAVPHVRHPSDKLFKESKIVFLRSKKGVDFLAPDGKKVNLFFMTCAQSEFIHLRFLAKISKLLHMKDSVKKLLAAKTKEEIIQIFLEFDKERMFFANKK